MDRYSGMAESGKLGETGRRMSGIWDARAVLTPRERAILKTRWIEIRGPRTKIGRHGSIPIDEAVPGLPAYMEYMALLGTSVGDIANELGLSQGAISNYCRRFGIQLKANRRSKSRVWSDIHLRFVPIGASMARRLGIRDRDPRHPDPPQLPPCGRGRSKLDICLRGHALTSDNRRKNGQCLTCARAHDRTRTTRNGPRAKGNWIASASKRKAAA